MIIKNTVLKSFMNLTLFFAHTVAVVNLQQSTYTFAETDSPASVCAMLSFGEIERAVTLTFTTTSITAQREFHWPHTL